MIKRRTYRAERGLGQVVDALALVSSEPFSARYDLDRDAGVISRLDHPLRGAAIAGMVLVCPAVQGGVAGGWAFLAMAQRGVGFAGLVFENVNPVVVQGAIAAGIPILSGIDQAIFAELRTGQRIRLDPSRLEVQVQA